MSHCREEVAFQWEKTLLEIDPPRFAPRKIPARSVGTQAPSIHPATAAKLLCAMGMGHIMQLAELSHGAFPDTDYFRSFSCLHFCKAGKQESRK